MHHARPVVNSLGAEHWPKGKAVSSLPTLTGTQIQLVEDDKSMISPNLSGLWTRPIGLQLAWKSGVSAPGLLNVALE